LIHVSEPTARSGKTADMTGMVCRHLIRLGLAAALVAAPPPLWAGASDEDDHDRARRAFERGEVLPLAEILARVRGELGGEVVGVSFEREHERWVYEFRVIGSGGRLIEVYVDAATAEVLEREEGD
jgi:uncharacterized membrane protein YkoI